MLDGLLMYWQPNFELCASANFRAHFNCPTMTLNDLPTYSQTYAGSRIFVFAMQSLKQIEYAIFILFVKTYAIVLDYDANSVRGKVFPLVCTVVGNTDNRRCGGISKLQTIGEQI